MCNASKLNLNGLPAAITNYLHHDYLGSLAVITDESGAVSECFGVFQSDFGGRDRGFRGGLCREQRQF